MLSEKSKIFISYARKDAKFALKLGKDLRESGLNIWIDQICVPLGENWDDVTEEALDACQSVIIILSPTSVTSKNVKDEISFALDENKTIYPVLYQECKVPLRIRRLQHISFIGNYDNGLSQLLDVLNIASEVESPSIHESMDLTKEDTQEPIATRHAEMPQRPNKKKSLDSPLVWRALILVSLVFGAYEILKLFKNSETKPSTKIITESPAEQGSLLGDGSLNESFLPKSKVSDREDKVIKEMIRSFNSRKENTRSKCEKYLINDELGWVHSSKGGYGEVYFYSNGTYERVISGTRTGKKKWSVDEDCTELFFGFWTGKKPRYKIVNLDEKKLSFTSKEMNWTIKFTAREN